MRPIVAITASLLAAGCTAIQPAKSLTASELLANPEKYEGKLVRVTGNVSYGFESCLIDGRIWYWPCWAANSGQETWSGHGYVLGVVSTQDHGHLGSYSLSLVQAHPVRER